MATTVIKTTNKTINKIEKIKLFISVYSILKGITITETEAIVLSSFLCDGISRHTKDELLRVKVVKNKNVLDNVISKMRAKGLIAKESFNEVVCRELRLNYDNNLLLELRID